MQTDVDLGREVGIILRRITSAAEQFAEKLDFGNDLGSTTDS